MRIFSHLAQQSNEALGQDAQWEDRSTYGQILETFVYQELRSWREETVAFSHYRDKDKDEVDVVMEFGGRVAAVEIKASSTVTSSDFRGLRKLQAATGKKFAAGVLLHDGENTVAFGEKLYAVPPSTLWETV